MDGEKRRKEILNILKTIKSPISGADLGKKFNVSRQVIVQDVALLRTAYPEILSTHRGYVLNQSKVVSRVFKVYHKRDKIEEELNLIVDLGARAVDVFVKHGIYGKIEANLNIGSRRVVRLFVDKVENNNIKPLTDITGGEHYHTVEAESESILDEVEEALRCAGILMAVEEKINLI